MIRRYLNLLLFKVKNPTYKVHYTTKVSRKAVAGLNCSLGSYTSQQPYGAIAVPVCV